MLKFFRSIRQNLLAQNKTSKYFKYAIGEIILVVIGILIALQINNWNEARKIMNVEQTLLKDLKIELTSNLNALEEVILEHEKSLKAAQELMVLSRKPRELINIPDTTVQRLVSTMNKNWTYNPKKGILNSIISSGQLTYIKNKELRYLLASIDDVTDDTIESTEEIERDKADLLNPSFIKGFLIENGKMVGYNVKGVLQAPEFWMATSGLFVDNRTYGIEEEKNLKQMIIQMLDLIDKEIKS